MRKTTSKIDYSEIAGIAIGAMAPGLLNKFAGNMLNKLPAAIQPLIPAAVGIALVNFGGKNTLIKSAGIGMVGTSFANFARTQFGIGAMDMDEIGAISYEVLDTVALPESSINGDEDLDYIGSPEDDEEMYPVAGVEEMYPVGVIDMSPVAGLI